MALLLANVNQYDGSEEIIHGCLYHYVPLTSITNNPKELINYIRSQDDRNLVGIRIMKRGGFPWLHMKQLVK